MSFFKYILILIFFYGFIGSCPAQYESRIDSIFQEFQNQPGVAIGVFKDGKIIHKKGYGIANLDYKIPITSQTVFDIGSVSKQFTGACIVNLVQAGKISLDVPIQKYIPEFPEYNNPITVRHLLHHTSGIRDYLDLMYMSGMSFDNVFTEEMGLEMILRQKKLNFPTGEKELYSNSGYLLLAIIIRRISGMSIGDFAKKHIFEPLGMNNTFILEDAHRVVKNRAIGYVPKGENEFEREHHFDFTIGGDGQVYTTIEDFFKWDQALKNQKINSNNFTNLLLQRGRLNSGKTINYAFGIEHNKRMGWETIEHNGAWGAFRANYVRFPSKDLSVVLMSNFSNVRLSSLTRQVYELFLEEKKEEVEEEEKFKIIKIEKALYQKLVGEYRFEVDPNLIIEVLTENDTLKANQKWNGEKYAIQPISETAFITDDNFKFAFSNFENDQPNLLQIGTKDMYDLKRVIPYKSIENKFFAGKYFSEELQVNYQIKEKKEKLILHLKGMPPIPLSPIGKYEFSCDLGKIIFNQNNNSITGFSIGDGRANGIHFSKK